MIPSSPCSPSYRRGSLISQLDFGDFLNMDKNSDWNHLAQEDIRRNSLNSQLNKSLQVVPDLDELYISKETTPGLEIQREFKDLHLSWPTITVNLANEPNSFNAAMSEKKEDTVPRSPFLPRTSISEIDNLEILSPLFSVTNNTSPVIKTPTTLYEICCSSRKSSDDLSIYLPDNFTPASLESLDKSINRSVFQFPATAPKHQTIPDDVFVNREERPTSSSASECNAKIPETSETREVNGMADDDSDQSSIKHEDKKLIDIALIKEKRAEKKRKHYELRKQREKRQKLLNEFENEKQKNENTSTTESSPVLRNKLERERRSDLNNRFQKLREIIPNLAGKEKASKIAILKAATDYANELKIEEKNLEESLKHEKARNQQLLKNLVNISTNLSDPK